MSTMTSGPAGLAQVTARVAQLQSMLGLGSGGVLGTSATSGGSATSSASSGFAGALADALGVSSAGVGDPGTATGSAALGQQAVALARSYSGVPYRWGGSDPSTGLDCSGLVQRVYRALGVNLPRVAADQAKAGVEVGSLAAAEPGDLVFFGSPAHHVGIYVGDGKMIDAPRAGKTVGVHEIAGYGTVSHVRRVTGAAEASAAAVRTARTQAAALGSTELLSAAGLSLGAGTGAAATGLSGPYAALFTAAGARYGLDPALLSAVAKTESGYDPTAVSGAGARGLMQLMPATARSLGVDPDDPAQAVDGAARLLANLMDRFDGRVDLALAGYNAGPGAVSRYDGVPPYPETRTYVHRVTRAWEALR